MDHEKSFESGDFLDRTREIQLLNDLTAKNGLLVVYGRRRIGKTRLLTEWLRRIGGLYIQATEGSPAAQLFQFCQDLRDQHDFGIEPKSWNELFRVLESYPGKLILAIDEFPYLVESDRSVPSLFQKWLDHRRKKDVLLVLSGSSQKIMHDSLLSRSSPLFGRAIREIRLEGMGYPHFCDAMRLRPDRIESYLWFSVTGGVPWYWSLMDSGKDLFANLDLLYFDSSPILEHEAKRLLGDERIGGLQPLSVLEMIGRGASRPSEIAARLAVPQTQLSKTFEALADGGFIRRENPVGKQKQVLYSIQDPALRFWFTVRVPHAARWRGYSEPERRNVLGIFASSVFEDEVRRLFPGSVRHWERDVEFDLFVENPGGRSARPLLGEIKFSVLSPAARRRTEAELHSRWERSELGRGRGEPEARVIDFADYLRMGFSS